MTTSVSPQTNTGAPEHLPADETTSQSVSEQLFQALDAGEPIEWKNRKHRRCTGLMPRAIFSILHCDELLRATSADQVKSSDHEEIVALLRKYGTGGQIKFDEHPDWQLWTISCLISDAQVRIAATFDRCVSFWALDLGLAKQFAKAGERPESIENYLTTFVGTRLAILRLFLRFLHNATTSVTRASKAETSEFEMFSELAIRSIDELDRVFNSSGFIDTNKAARQIGYVQNNHYRSALRENRLGECISAAQIKLISEAGKSLSDDDCLGITWGRVNDFKHRATAPIIPGTFLDMNGHYQRHAELAVTIRALVRVIGFYKLMAAHLRKVPAMHAGDISAPFYSAEVVTLHTSSK